MGFAFRAEHVMGQIRAKLTNELTIAEALRDLQRESGDSERHVLALLAEVVENSEFGKYRISIYAKRRDSIKSKRTDTGEDVDATIQRKLAVAFPSLALRLREAARDGWTTSSRRIIQVDARPVAIADLIIEKPSLITALEAERVNVPQNWMGAESPADKDARIAQRAMQLKASGDKRFLQTIAKEERVTASAIKTRIARARARVAAKKASAG